MNSDLLSRPKRKTTVGPSRTSLTLASSLSTSPLCLTAATLLLVCIYCTPLQAELVLSTNPLLIQLQHISFTQVYRRVLHSLTSIQVCPPGQIERSKHCRSRAGREADRQPYCPSNGSLRHCRWFQRTSPLAATVCWFRRRAGDFPSCRHSFGFLVVSLIP